MATPKKELRPIPGQKWQLFKRHPNINRGRHTHLDYAASDEEMRQKKEMHILSLPGWQVLEVPLPRRFWPAKKRVIAGHSWQVVGTNQAGNTVTAMLDGDDIYQVMCKAIQERGVPLSGIRSIKYDSPIYAEE